MTVLTNILPDYEYDMFLICRLKGCKSVSLVTEYVLYKGKGQDQPIFRSYLRYLERSHGCEKLTL